MSKASVLERLMAADGLCLAEPAWRRFVEEVAETLDVGPGTRVFQVGCGAGAFLYPLSENGYLVGGLERSPILVADALKAIPEGRFMAGDASTLDPAEPWDVVLACGAFTHFPDLDYARGVLARMAAKATHAVAILDLPDLDRQAAAPDQSPDSLFYERGWMLKALAETGVSAVQIEEQKIEGYANAPFRFNVFARL